MSTLFENLSYEPQCTSSIWTECSKWCVVMLRFACLYNTWAETFVMKHPCTPKQSIRAIIGGVHQLGRTKARAESVPLHALTSHALSRTHFDTPLHRAHWIRTHVSHTIMTLQNCSNRARQSAKVYIALSIVADKQRKEISLGSFKETCDRTSAWQSERSSALEVLITAI